MPSMRSRPRIEIQRAMLDQDTDLAEDQRIRYRVGMRLGDVIVMARRSSVTVSNIAARMVVSQFEILPSADALVGAALAGPRSGGVDQRGHILHAPQPIGERQRPSPGVTRSVLWMRTKLYQTV